MSSPTQSPPPGWYSDPASPAMLRWFDGWAWTGHIARRPSVAVDGLSAPNGCPSTALPPSPAVDPDRGLRWILPVGRTWQSIVAGYVALFAVLLWFLGPIALVVGLWALHASEVGRGIGRGRAWFAIIVGTLSSAAMLLHLLLALDSRF